MQVRYKVLICVIMIYAVIMGIIIYSNNRYNTQIIIYPDISLKYESKEWKSNDFNSKINYNIYEDNDLLAKGLLQIENGLTYYNNTQLNNFIAASSNKTKIINYDINTDNSNYVNVLKKLNITKYNDFRINQKITIDYDNDSQLEEIYILSNLFVDPFMEDINDEKFSILYTIDDGETNVIYSRKFLNDMKGCLLKLAGIMDANNDNKYELITTCSYFDKIGIKVQIYELIKNKYKLIKEI